MFNLISPAYAESAAAVAEAGAPSIFIQLAPLFVIFAIFYLIVIRPQSKRIKAHHDMLDTLKKGDRVVTGGGIKGKLKKIDGLTATVEIAKGVEVQVVKQTLSASDDLKNKNK